VNRLLHGLKKVLPPHTTADDRRPMSLSPTNRPTTMPPLRV